MYGRFPDDVHVKDFLDCVRSRKRPNGEIEVVHTACTMAHIGNIAHRVGNEKLWFDSRTERFVANDEANKLVRRAYRKKKYEVPERL
jgi:hypothetical protein